MRDNPESFWRCEKKHDGLLFFAQTVEEMLFDYAPDSYRVNTLNSLGRLREAQFVIRQITRERVDKKNIKPILEELKWSIQKDPIIKDLMRGRVGFVTDHFNDFGNLKRTEKGIVYILRNIERRYLGSVDEFTATI